MTSVTAAVVIGGVALRVEKLAMGVVHKHASNVTSLGPETAQRTGEEGNRHEDA
eukprot:CAMPEP_0185170502 /NCGR_PEP_ID=MMETSP1139-20130426/18832_1 /TAXON_ID=298111 /ORGANISM="Pavlova sp., Strain CCMP459" /LENGTH=53 /DNA_ID=CAMNT_0027736061 /DNA_START=398 /DNA_END=555 /DNA_ORIENTATION=+